MSKGSLSARRTLTIAAVLLLLLAGDLSAQNTPFGDDANVTRPGQTVSGSAGAASAAADRVAIDRAWVNVRSGPGTDFRVVKTLPQGASGKKIDEKNGWFLIDFGNGVKGWVRGDLVAATASPAPTPTDKDRLALEKGFERWDRHLGTSLLDFGKFPWYWSLGRAWKAFQAGDFARAYDLAQDSSSNPVEARYLMAKSLAKLGRYAEARQLMATIEKSLEDMAFLQVIDQKAKPYIDANMAFKFGGFDDVATYKTKTGAGNRSGLESSEYYSDFVDINTWTWKSPQKAKEFGQIAGIDCSGLVQRIQMDAFKSAKVPYPIPGRTSTSGLWSQKYTKSINPGVKPPPPPDIRPGDMILLDYGHNRYGHSMIYRGMDAKGNIRAIMMGDTPEETIIPAEKYQFYKGTYRMNGMDKVRQTLTA